MSAQTLRRRAGRIYHGARNRAAYYTDAAELLRRHGLPDHLITFGAGIGDQLLCTAIAHELRARGARRIWLMSDHGALFRHNPDIDLTVPMNPALVRAVERFGRRVIRPIYTRRDATTDRDIPPPRHLLAVMCEMAGLGGMVSLRPYLHLTAEEQAAGRIAPRQIAMQSSGMAARFPMGNKEWFPGRFQQVAQALAADATIVQLGAASDPAIVGAHDLRGKTSLRETAAILSQSVLFVGQVGLLMHLARAVECRAAIVYGGREAPWQSGYSANENIYNPVPCAPCWLWNRCEFDRRCMREIVADDVIAACRRALARTDLPLDVEQICI